MDIWKEREFELSQRHEEILKIRETILRGTEAYYDSQENRASSFITDYKKAKNRNALLLQDIDRASNILEKELGDNPSHKQFHTLTTNYWGMVRNVFPVWLEDQRQYEHKHGLTYSTKNIPWTQGGPTQPQSGGMSSQHSALQDSARPDSRQSGGDTTRTIPPLELDFSMGEDLTVSQVSGFKQTLETTPKSALASSSGKGGKNKKVQIKDEKKERELEKKERERQRKEREKEQKEQKRRQKEEEKERKKSARSNKSQ